MRARHVRKGELGLAPLEANACGTQVVAITEGGVRESVQHEQNGLLETGGDPKELARAVERLIDDKDFARELRERSLRYVQAKWQMQSATDRLEAVLVAVEKGESLTNPGDAIRPTMMCFRLTCFGFFRSFGKFIWRRAPSGTPPRCRS